MIGVLINLAALMISFIRGTPRVTFIEATPAKWKVLRVICVPGSPMDCAPTAPTVDPACGGGQNRHWTRWEGRTWLDACFDIFDPRQGQKGKKLFCCYLAFVIYSCLVRGYHGDLSNRACPPSFCSPDIPSDKSVSVSNLLSTIKASNMP
jgi:hypothetical protein